MAGYVGSERATLYKGDYKPAELYAPIYKKTRGVNLFRVITPASREGYGMSIKSMVGDSFVTLDGTSTSADAYLMGSTDNQTVLEKGVYTISVRNMQHVSTAHDRFLLYFRSGKLITVPSDSPTVTFELTEEQTISYFGIVYGKSTYNNQKILIQIEKGSTATEWEPYSDGEAKLISWGLNKYLGYKTSQYMGKEIAVQNTYNDTLDLLLKGEHSQKNFQGYNLLDVRKYADIKCTMFGQAQGKGVVTWSEELITFVPYIPYPNPNNLTSTDMAIDVVFNNYMHLEAGKYTGSFKYEKKNIDDKFLLLATNTATQWGSNLIKKDGTKAPFDYSPPLSQQAGTSVFTFTVTEAGDYQLHLGVDYPDLRNTNADSYFKMWDFQVEKGATAHEYEPYVGGAPAPSPQFPQQIEHLAEEKVEVSGNVLPHILPNNSTWTEDGWILKDADSYDNIFSMRQFVPKTGTDYTLVIEVDDENVNQYNYSYTVDSRFTTEYVKNKYGILMNGYFQEILKQGINRFYVRTFEEFPVGCLGTMWVHSARGLPALKYRVAIYEGWHEDAVWTPYRETQQLAKNFNLYGADGVYDTLEPCVLLDGEWKCRVTRYWRYMELNGTEYCTTQWMPTVVFGLEGKPKWKPRFNQNKDTHGIDFRSTNDSGTNFGFDISKIGLNNSATVEDIKNWLKQQYENGTPVRCVYCMLEPIVELYDPIMLNTNPYTTIIKGNAEMLANIKSVEY